MSRHSSHERAASENAETLEVIREEQCSPAISSVNMVNMDAVSKTDDENQKTCVDCKCAQDLEKLMDQKISPEEVEKLMLDREAALRREFLQSLETERSCLKDRFDFILQ